MVPTPRQGRAADAGLNNKADVRNESHCPVNSVNEFIEILRGFVELNANGYAREGERREALKHASDCLFPMPKNRCISAIRRNLAISSELSFS